MSDTVQRLIGSCQICEGEFKLDQGATMVHHGYKRPGHGYIVGDCYAVGQPAYEQSCECLKRYLELLHDKLSGEQDWLERLESGQVLELNETVQRYGGPPETRTYKKGTREYDRVLHSKSREAKRAIEWFERDIKRCEQRIQDWRPLPIRTIEESQAEKRASKEQAQAAREAKRQAKLAEKVAGYQKRIDSAVRRHTTSSIAEIFESAPSKLREIAGRDLDKAGALALLGRDHVWAAFGLVLEGDREQSRKLGKMRFDDNYPWPLELT